MPANSHYLETAIRAARTGGRVLLRYFGKELRIEYKGELNLVTEADRRSEAAILDVIRKAFPTHGVLAEESGEQGGSDSRDSEYKWIIDPLDGTTNFTHSFPFFCVSVGLAVRGSVVLGAVYDPVRKELFLGERGQGSTLNGKPIRVSKTENLIHSLLVTGFPYDLRNGPRNNLDYFSSLTLQAQGIRRTGSAALDLCYVACGRFDGFWEQDLLPWDTAAGLVIALEAGAMVTDFSKRPFDIYAKEIIASNGQIHDEIVKVLNAVDRER